jgi:hypothetical protein
MMPENTRAMDTNSIPRLVSAARREFLNRQGYSPIQVETMEKNGTPEDEWSGPQMQGDIVKCCVSETGASVVEMID